MHEKQYSSNIRYRACVCVCVRDRWTSELGANINLNITTVIFHIGTSHK